MAVYAISDLHGCLDLYKQVKAFLKPEDKVYCLGDCGDRGPQPWETIKAVARDPQFIYLKGNHEDMLTEAFDVWEEHEYRDYDYRLLVNNGGGATFEGLAAEKECSEWNHFLKKLPTHVTYDNSQGFHLILSHAGFTPWSTNNNEIVIPSKEDLVWDRDHLRFDWEDSDKLENVIIVHGHTPIPYVMRDQGIYTQSFEPGAFWYFNDHKVCIDNASFATGYTCLLDLDTFEEHIFFVNKDK